MEGQSCTLSAGDRPANTTLYPILFHYAISTTMRRQHGNPPIWTDFHYHDFRVTLHLQAMLEPAAMYGIDMIEAEQRLRGWAEQLPQVVNNHPTCGGGTTEELCLYFAQMPLDAHMELLRVDVSEVPERVTSLIVSRFLPLDLNEFNYENSRN